MVPDGKAGGGAGYGGAALVAGGEEKERSALEYKY